MQRFLAKLIPFIFLGIILVVLLLGIILFSYLLILGALVGLVLFAIQWTREKFSRPKYPVKRRDQHRSGRTFDHHD